MKPRRTGSVYRRGRIWWIKYYDRTGRARRESSHSDEKAKAEDLLSLRRGDVASGKRLIGADLERTTFEHLAQMIRDDYQLEKRRSTERLEIALKRLGRHLAGWKARDIDFASMQSYRLAREKMGAAPATVRWELGALRRAFNLAARSGRAELPQFPTLHVANAREGFFEPQEWQAIRAHLRPEFQDFGDFAYLTGWRTMEVLGLRWRQIDFNSQTIRLEPGTTKTGAGRMFPFGDYRELRELIERRKMLRDQVQKAWDRLVPWIFFFQANSQFHRAGDPLHHEHKGHRRACDAIRMEWREATIVAKLPDRIPHDFRRTAARNMERAGVPRSVAMALGGWKSESMYRRYAIASESDLREGVKRLAVTGLKKKEVEM